MTKFQNIKFYVLCRHRLNTPSEQIFAEINKLFGVCQTRTYADSVVRWIELYESPSLTVRERHDLFSYSRRNKYGTETLRFQMRHDLSEPNSIQKKKFYTMCRYQLEATPADICTIFEQEALYVVNDWIEQCWSVGSQRVYINSQQNDYIRLRNNSTSVVQSAELVELRAQLNEARCEANACLEEKTKLEVKLREEASLAKRYWESSISKLNTEITDLKSHNSQLECDLYKMSQGAYTRPVAIAAAPTNECECERLRSQIAALKSEHATQIQILNRTHNEQANKLIADYTVNKENVNELTDRIAEQTNEIKSVKRVCRKRLTRSSKLITMNRIKLREVYFNKLKYLIKRTEKTELYVKRYASKILKEGGFFYANNIKYEGHEMTNNIKINLNGILADKFKFEKYESTAHV